MVLRSFNDIEIRNMAAMYLLFEGARESGSAGLLTGDGADEIFAGYGFLERSDPQELPAKMRRLAAGMRFPAGEIAGSMGMEACAPFMDPAVVRAAAAVPPRLHVRGGRGKAALREAFAGALPESILQRPKAPMQDGAGTSAIAGLLESQISDAEFAAGAREALAGGVRIRSKESLYYYREFSKAGPELRARAGRVPRLRAPGVGLLQDVRAGSPREGSAQNRVYMDSGAARPVGVRRRPPRRDGREGV